MFANIAPATYPPVYAVSGLAVVCYILAIVLAAVMALEFVCRECPRPVHMPAERQPEHYALHHAKPRTQCRSCEHHKHNRDPHPCESGAPCECSCVSSAALDVTA